MSEGGQSHKNRTKDAQDVATEETTDATAEETKDLLDDVDELLDEIDDVLEENAEEFVRGYVQKGGQ